MMIDRTGIIFSIREVAWNAAKYVSMISVWHVNETGGCRGCDRENEGLFLIGIDKPIVEMDQSPRLLPLIGPAVPAVSDSNKTRVFM